LGKKIASALGSRSVRLSFFVSYLAVLLAPILLSLVVFFNNYHVVRNHAAQIYAVTSRHLTALVNTYVEEIRSESLSLILNSYSQNLMSYRSSTPTTTQILQLRSLQKTMSYKAAVSSYIQEIYAVFPKSDVILSDHGVFYNHNFSYKCQEALGMTLEEWDGFLDFPGDRRIAVVKSSLDGVKRVLVVQKNPGAGSSGAEMLVLTVLNVSVLQDILDELSQDGQSLSLIYDKNTGCVLQSSAGQPSYTVQEGTIVSDGAQISAQDTDFGSWSCALLTPEAAYRAATKPFWASMLLYLATCLTAGAFLVAYLSKKQFSPVQKIIAQMLEAAGLTPSAAQQNENEYDQIEQTLKLLLYQSRSIEEENSVMRRGFQEHVLRNILFGRIVKDSILYRHAYNSGIVFQSDRFCVVLYDIEDFGRILSGVDFNADSDDSLSSVMEVVVFTAVQDIAEERYTRYAVEMDGCIACIVCCPEELEAEQVEADMVRDANLVSSFLREKFGLCLSAAVSGVCTEIRNITLCYHEALETLDYMEAMGITAAAYRYRQLPEHLSGTSVPLDTLLNKVRLMGNYIRAGDIALSQQALEEIAQDLRGEKLSAAEARLRMYGLISTVAPALEYARSELANPPASLNPEALLQAKSPYALCGQIMELLDLLAQADDRCKSEKSLQQKEAFIQYITENLTDFNLNVTAAANRFGMSPSYFSRIFKKSIGMGFLDYVHSLRMDMAKELILQEPHLPLKDVADRVGYSTPLALNRAFRKYEGISPSIYREQNAG
jgi:AraC-like DNA-binding protein